MDSIRGAFENPGALKAKAKQVSPVPNNDVRIPTIRSIKETAAVAEKRQYIADIPAHMAGLVARIRGIQVASSEEKTIRSKEFKDLEDEVLAHLSSEELILRNAAVQAYAEAMVSTLPADKRLVIETIKAGENSRLPGLLQLKVLELGDDKNAVTVRVYRYVYTVNGGREFALKLAKALAEGAANAAKVAHDQYHGEVAALKAQATISIIELLARKPGKFFLDVPDDKDKDGERFLPGGALLGESDGRKVKVVGTIGHFSRIMAQIAEADIFISVDSLSTKRFSGDGRLPPGRFRLYAILHEILRRGLAAEFARQKSTAPAAPAKIIQPNP